MNRIKRLLTLLLLACGMTTGTWAQTAQLIRDGYLIKTFTGASSLSSAISAAASKGDIIILSSGNFNNPGNITKSVSIYGQGFENSTAIGGARTYISGKLEYKLMSEGALDGIHLEGLYIENDLNILTNIGTTAIVDDFTVIKCHSGGVFFYQRSTNVKLQNCKFDRDVRTYPNSYTTTMQVDNCYIEGNLFNFADGSNIIVNNSLIHNNWYQDYSAATSFNNCIIYKNISNGSSATKCIFNQSSVSGSTDNCWTGVNNGDIYVAEGEDGSYSESKSFAVKDTYVGTDDTPVGLQGGIGWNKTPTIPSYLIPDDLTQDDEGYYLLSTKINWIQFAEIVNGGTTNANARMIADIDLGDDQTTVGTMETPFQGIFDGQGHTLTINFTPAEERFGLFRFISGATIRNLNVTGTITTAYRMVGSLVGRTDGNSSITNCRSNVYINSTTDEGHQTGGLVGRVSADVTLNISDCVFDGSIIGKSSSNFCGGIVGYNVGTLNMSNCLFMPVTAQIGSSNLSTLVQDGGTTNISNCYYTTAMGTVQGTLATTITLSNGTITAALQNGREDLVWGQRIGTDAEPVLTSDENYRVYRSVNGGYTNDPDEAYSGIQQDGEGYYLISCVADWQDFAAIVNNGTNTAANARMTADINIGNDQTHIGSMTQEVGPFYSGTFDGQGHTLTIAYDDRTGNKIIAPFTQIRNATIKNLKVAGSIYSTFAFLGVVGYVNGGSTSYISNVWSSASITCAHSGWKHTSGIVGSVGNGATANVSDCLVTGSVSASDHSGPFVGLIYGGTAYISNCLSTGTLSVSSYATGTTTNSYVKGYSAEVTDANLSDGTITGYLQNNREETVWVQDPLTNQPMLAVFAGKYTVPASGIGTFSAKANFTLPDGLEAYYCKDYDSEEGSIGVVAIDGTVPANTGVLLKGTAGETYTLTISDDEATTVTDNALVAVTTQTAISQTAGDYTNFGLSGGVFKKVNSNGGTVKANRAYLHIPTSALTAEAREISLVWDEDVTGINDVRSQTDDVRGVYYDLQGRRVVNPTKGLYIVNGRKVIVK